MYRLLLTFCLAAVSLTLVGCHAPGVPQKFAHPGLGELINAKSPCRVRLQPPWIGEAKATIRTGYFVKDQPAEVAKLDNELRFDWFVYSDERSRFNYGSRYISQAVNEEGETEIHTYRVTLPSDSEIASAKTISKLTELFGEPQGATDGWGAKDEFHSSAGWSFFSRKDPQTIETLSVFCMVAKRKGETDWRIESMKVLRGTAHPSFGTDRRP